MVCVIPAVGEEPTDRSGQVEQGSGNGDVVYVAGGQQKNARASLLVGQRVELARPAPARVADSLEERPPFPPAAERCALM